MMKQIVISWNTPEEQKEIVFDFDYNYSTGELHTDVSLLGTSEVMYESTSSHNLEKWMATDVDIISMLTRQIVDELIDIPKLPIYEELDIEIAEVTRYLASILAKWRNSSVNHQGTWFEQSEIQEPKDEPEAEPEQVAEDVVYFVDVDESSDSERG